MKNNKVKVIPLGGLGEVGKNTAIEYQENYKLIVAWPFLIWRCTHRSIPNVSYLLENRRN